MDTIKARLTDTDWQIHQWSQRKPTQEELDEFAKMAKATLLAQKGPNLCNLRVHTVFVLDCNITAGEDWWFTAATMTEFEPITE